MYVNIVFLPLIGSFLSGLFGRYLGPYGAGIVTTSCVASVGLGLMSGRES